MPPFDLTGLILPEQQPVNLGREVENTIAVGPSVLVYAFATSIDFAVAPDDAEAPNRCIANFECIDAEWMARRWKTGLEETIGPLLSRLNAASFEVTYRESYEAPDDFIHGFHELHLQFLKAMHDPEDPAPVALYHVVLDTGNLAFELREERWYLAYLGDATPFPQPLPSYAHAELRRGLFSQMGQGAVADPPSTLRRVEEVWIPDPLTHELLIALHYPQFNPGEGGQRPPPPRDPEPTGSLKRKLQWDDMEPGLRKGIKVHRAIESLRGRAASWLDRIRRWLEPPDFPWSLVPAGGPWTIPAALPRYDPPSGAAYVGSPRAAGPAGIGGVLPQIPNPMTAAGVQQPFIGVLNIGQGNLNALYGSAAEVIAYYDFGTPTPILVGTNPAVQHSPCVHDDPLIVLSHWDYDHAAMARRVPHSFEMRWIAPQHPIGSVMVREVYSRIVLNANGGQLHLWPAGAPAAHLRLPWGYIERGLGPGANDSGLVMYVCVRDAAGGPPVPGPVFPAAPLTPRVVPPQPTCTLARAGAQGAFAAAAAGGVNVQLVAAAAGALNAETAALAAAAPMGAPLIQAAAAAAMGAAPGAMLLGAGPGAAAILGVVAGAGAGAISGAAGGIAALGVIAAAANGAGAMPVAPALGLWGAPAVASAVAVVAAAMAVNAGLTAAVVASRARVAVVQAVRNAVVVPPMTAPFGAPPPPAPVAWPVVGAAAVPLAGRVPAQAPFLPDERYVLLSGDVSFEFMPTQQQLVAPPAVVGLLASHHGARTCFMHGNLGRRLRSKAQVPWAPGSPAAAAGAAAGIAMGGATKLTAAAAAYLTAEVAQLGGFPAAAVPAATMAAVATAAAGAVGRQAMLLAIAGLGGGPWLQAMAGAAATLRAELAGAGGVTVAGTLGGVAGALGSAATSAAVLAAAPAGNAAAMVAAGAAASAAAGGAPAKAVAAAASAIGAEVAAAAGAGAPAAIEYAVAATAAVGAGAGYVAKILAIAGAAGAGGISGAAGMLALGGGALSAAAALTAAGVGGMGGAAATPVAAAIAIADAAVAAAGAGPLNLPSVIATAARDAAIATGLLAGLVIPPAFALGAAGEPYIALTAVAAATDAALDALAGGDASTAQTAARVAATLVAAAPGWVLPAAAVVPLAAPPYANVASAAVRAATEAAAAGAAGAAATAAAHALAVHGAIASGRIAYSYGLTAANGHTNFSGGFGHPHPEGIVQYRARGWSSRMNTPIGAPGSLQPDASPAGPCALGWEIAFGYEGPLRGDGGGGGVLNRNGCELLCDPRTYNC